jgi:hypothetical protein
MRSSGQAKPLGSGLGWDDPVSRSTAAFFVQTLTAHTRVKTVEADNGNVYVIERHNLPGVRVWVCDVYTLGIADYLAIREQSPDVGCIVTMSGYNAYTPQAKAQGLGDEVGVFKFKELMGALHSNREDFVAYQPPKEY